MTNYETQMGEDNYIRIYIIYFKIFKWVFKSLLRFPIYNPINNTVTAFVPKYVNQSEAVEAAEFFLEHTARMYKEYVLQPIFVKGNIFMNLGEGVEEYSFSNVISMSQRLYIVDFGYKQFIGSSLDCAKWLDVMEEKTYR